MIYLPTLNDDEVRYIFSQIPYPHIIRHFTKSAKEFNKMRPGFRAKSISEIEAIRLLTVNRHRPFIADFIEFHLSNWLGQINDYYNEQKSGSDNHISALLHTLPRSVFAENVALYFKLVNEDIASELIDIISTAVLQIKEDVTKNENLQQENEIKDSTINKLKTDVSTWKSALSKSKEKIKDLESKIDALKSEISAFEAQAENSRDQTQKIASLEGDIKTYKSTVDSLKTELSRVQAESYQLVERISDDLEKQKGLEIARQRAMLTPKCPDDMEEFIEYLSYNFESLGISVESDCLSLLAYHLSKILFLGVPIVINRITGFNIMNCVANALIGKISSDILPFERDISTDKIDQFLSNSGRVACLDNFIGNCNETELLSIVNKHKDKIIFLTVTYDRTIAYISKDFLRYCVFLNTNRIQALTCSRILAEEPSIISESESRPEYSTTDNRYKTCLYNILSELSFQRILIEQKCADIFSEQDLCRILAFDVLPYCTDVLQINPYNTSERLVKYAGTTGRCPSKNLLMRWFA